MPSNRHSVFVSEQQIKISRSFAAFAPQDLQSLKLAFWFASWLSKQIFDHLQMKVVQ